MRVSNFAIRKFHFFVSIFFICENKSLRKFTLIKNFRLPNKRGPSPFKKNIFHPKILFKFSKQSRKVIFYDRLSGGSKVEEENDEEEEDDGDLPIAFITGMFNRRSTAFSARSEKSIFSYSYAHN